MCALASLDDAVLLRAVCVSHPLSHLLSRFALTQSHAHSRSFILSVLLSSSVVGETPPRAILSSSSFEAQVASAERQRRETRLRKFRDSMRRMEDTSSSHTRTLTRTRDALGTFLSSAEEGGTEGGSTLRHTLSLSSRRRSGSHSALSERERASVSFKGRNNSDPSPGRAGRGSTSDVTLSRSDYSHKEGSLYAVGGFNGGALASMELLREGRRNWCYVASMITRRDNFAVRSLFVSLLL